MNHDAPEHDWETCQTCVDQAKEDGILGPDAEPHSLRTFTGREIATELVKAVEALPSDAEIVTVKAGENMLITIAFVRESTDNGYIPEYAWDGENFREIGYL